jgi:hypothetical protein
VVVRGRESLPHGDGDQVAETRVTWRNRRGHDTDAWTGVIPQHRQRGTSRAGEAFGEPTAVYVIMRAGRRGRRWEAEMIQSTGNDRTPGIMASLLRDVSNWRAWCVTKGARQVRGGLPRKPRRVTVVWRRGCHSTIRIPLECGYLTLKRYSAIMTDKGGALWQR